MATCDQRDFLFQNAGSQLLRIGNCGRGADELGLRPVEPRDPLQPPQDVCQVAAKHPTIVVELIDYYVLQVLKQALPLGMVRQHARVKHVRVGDHQVPTRADRLSGILRCIAIVSEGANLVGQADAPAVQLDQLILRERLRGKEVQRAGFRIFHQLVQDWQVVAERFARSSRCDYHDVLAFARQFRRLCLMHIKLMDPALLQNFYQARCKKIRKGRQPSLARGKAFECRHAA